MIAVELTPDEARKLIAGRDGLEDDVAMGLESLEMALERVEASSAALAPTRAVHHLVVRHLENEGRRGFAQAEP